jgi:hypothetical protein
MSQNQMTVFELSMHGMRFLANFLYHAWWGGVSKQWFEKRKKRFFGGCPIKKPRKSEKKVKIKN